MQVSIAPAIGNMAYEMKVKGKDVLWFLFAGPAELRAKPALCAIPFLGPWANRLDGMEYWVNGKRYALNPGLGNLRLDHNGKPIHGLLNFRPLWKWRRPGRRQPFGVGHEPAGVLEIPGADGAVPVRARSK